MPDTVWSRLLQRATAEPGSVAILQKRFGLWTETSSAALVGRAGRTALALRDEGVGRGDVIALVLAPHEDRVVIDLAAQLVGAQVVGIATGTPLETVRHILADAAPRFAVVQGQAAADGILELIDAGALPTLERMWYLDPAGVQEYVATVLAPFPEVAAEGSPPAALEGMVAEIAPDAPAVRNHTSGTTGLPTPVVLTHANLLAAAEATVAAFGLGAGDRVLSFRPLSDPVERGATLFPALLSGATLVLPESRTSVGQAMVEVAPTYLHLTSRFVEELATDVRLRMQAAHGLKRLVVRSWNRRLVAAADAGRTPQPSVISRALVGRPVLAKLGLDQVRWLLVSGTAISPEALAFFAALGVRVRPAYSCAEAGGIAMAATAAEATDDQALQPLPGVEVRVVDDELQLRGAPIAVPDGTDGWLRTGDRAEEVAAGTVVTGRVGQVVATPGGRAVTAQQLAARLRSSPYIKEAVAVRESDALVAVLEPAIPTIGRWASRQGLRFTTPRSLLERPEVRDLLERATTAAAERLDVRVDEVRVLGEPLGVRTGTLTFTEKAIADAVLAAPLVSRAASPTAPTASPEGAPAR